MTKFEKRRKDKAKKIIIDNTVRAHYDKYCFETFFNNLAVYQQSVAT